MNATQENPWQPYEPSDADPWDLSKVAHLHRRAGFGATWSELHRDLEAGPAASVDRFLSPPAPSESELATFAGLRKGAFNASDVQRLKAYWLFRMRFSNAPLVEKLTLFWHGHFATSIRKVSSLQAMAKQVEMLRENALGSFGTLANAITGDAAMLIWLDGRKSEKEHPNENYAREFLELFTLGPGNYGETDVREAARAFTGWKAEDAGRGRSAEADPVSRFHRSDHDNGMKTFLGSAGSWNGEAIVRLTLEQPAAALFLARKLYRHFVDDSAQPADDLIRPLAEELRTSGYSIRHVMSVILRSRHFYAKSVRNRIIKSPVDFSLGMVRMLEVPRSRLNLLALASTCDRQGQELFAPPSVKGWDGGESWISSASLLERLNWATDFVWGNRTIALAPFDPAEWAESHGITPRDAAGAFVELLFQNELPAEIQRIVIEASADGGSDGLRKSLQRALHCPAFQIS